MAEYTGTYTGAYGTPTATDITPVSALGGKWTWALAVPVTGAAKGPVEPGGIFADLARAKGRRLTVRVDPVQSHEAVFSINGSAAEAAQVDELFTDLVVMRNQEVLFRGRIAPSSDTLDGTIHDTSFTARSYRDLLQRRTLMNDAVLSWTSADQASIVWDLISYMQGQPSGALGITRGLGSSTGVSRTVTYTAADYIGDRISELAQMDDGFDWDITAYGPADLRLDIWAPSRGLNRGVVLEYGGALVSSISRNVDPWGYSNALYVTGDSGAALSPIIAEDAAISSMQQGRWESAVGTSIQVQSALNAYAAWQLTDAEVVQPSYTVTMRASTWGGPGHIWIGDIVRLRIRSGRLDVDEDIRVVQMDISPGEDNDEQVVLTLGRIPPDPRHMISKMLRRVRNLELR